MTLSERFWSKVDKDGPGGCWVWMAGRSAQGYGRFWIDGDTRAAYRVAYEVLVGPVPDGLQLDHLCRNRACVNPGHLEPVTVVTNVMRGVSFAAENARKTACLRGHEFTAENTYIDRRGRRLCRECQRARQRAWQIRKADAASVA